MYFLTGELEGKRLGILRELVPDAALIGVVLNPNLPNAADRIKDAQAAST